MPQTLAMARLVECVVFRCGSARVISTTGAILGRERRLGGLIAQESVDACRA